MTGTLTRIWSWVKQTIQGGWHTDQNTGPEAKNNYSSTIKSDPKFGNGLKQSLHTDK